MTQRLTPSLVLCSLLASCANLGLPESEASEAGLQGDPPSTESAPPRDSADAREGARQDSSRTLVTARKLEEDILDVPRSITAIDGKRIEESNIQNIRDASLLVPNTFITEFTSRRLSFPYVRGVGSGQGDPAVTTFIDGVPQLTVNSTNLPMTGIERVEFVRGPQSVLYGRNTVGGAINIVTREPSDVMRGDARVSFGNFRFQEYEAGFEAPLVEDGLHLGATILHSRREGYTDNDLLGKDADSRESWFARAQLLWNPDDRNQLRFVFHGERARDGGFVLSELNGLRNRPNHISQDFDGRIDRDVISNSLVWTRAGDEMDFTSITSVQDWDVEEDADFDFSQIDGVRRFTREEQTAITQEFRLSSAEGRGVELGDGVTMRWLAGVMGFWADSDRASSNVFRPGGVGILFGANQVGTDAASGVFEDYAVGVFGQASFEIGDALEVTGALRYDYEKKDAEIRRNFTNQFGTFPTASTDRDEDFDAWLPRLSVSYRIDDNFMPYAVAARGFKAGGFNLTAPSGFESFGLEKSWTYELGLKTEWPDAGLTTTLALFHIDWEDMQLSQFDSNSGGYVANAGESQSQGVELEAAWQACEGLVVRGGVGLLDTEFDRFRDSYGTDVSGNDLPFAPEFTGNIGAQWTKRLDDDLALRLGGEWIQVGKFFYDASNLGQERFGLANFRAALVGDRWSFEAWVRNAFDQRYQPIAFQANPADPSAFVGESSAPRTLGVTLRVRLGGKQRRDG